MSKISFLKGDGRIMKFKSQIKKISALFLAVTVLTSIASCEGEQKKYESELYAMNTVINLTCYGSDATAQVSTELNRLESLFSVTRENSDIWRINSSQGCSIEISDETAEVLNIAEEIYNDTDTAFDPSIYPVVRLWGFTTDSFSVPSKADIQNALKLVDYSKVKIEGNTVTSPQGAMLDLGGIAKGYAGRICRDLLKANGVDAAVLSLGGNVQTVGKNPNGGKWKIALRNPDGGQYLCNILVDECAVVTSGGYERYFESDGKRYHHIIDPATGYPADSEFKSVTVIAQDGAVADALSTAFYIGGLQLVKEYLSSHSGIEVILYTNDNELIVSKDISSSLEFNGAIKEAQTI